MFCVHSISKLLDGKKAALAVTKFLSAGGSRGVSTWRREELGRGGEVRLLGVESSCDDTGVAVLGEDGRVLGEAIHSQLHTHKQ